MAEWEEKSVEDLDLDYEIMALFVEYPDVSIRSPLNLQGKQEFEPLEALCETWGTNIVYIHLCLLEEYRLVERSGDPSRYGLTPAAMAFLSQIQERGGWARVKQSAIECPVRLVMAEVCRWVLDGCPGACLDSE